MISGCSFCLALYGYFARKNRRAHWQAKQVAGMLGAYSEYVLKQHN